MFKVGKRLAIAQESLAHSEIMQRLARAQRALGQNAMVKQLALAPRSIARRGLTSFIIALIAAGLAMLAAKVSPSSLLMHDIDIAMYDSFFRRRPPESKLDGQVVMIMVDEGSIERMVKSSWKLSWPWPRDNWANVIRYLEKCQAKVIAFDLTFDTPSIYQSEVGDDTELAAALDQRTIPVVIAEDIPPDGKPKFAPPTSQPVTFGAVNVEDRTVRTYVPAYRTHRKLAQQTLESAGMTVPRWAENPFQLHYYGPHERDGVQTFPQVPAMDVVLAAQPDNPVIIPAVTPDKFRGKIVLIGAQASKAYDVKASPIDPVYPGTETQATAITNMLENRFVHVLGTAMTFGVGFLGAFLAGIGAIVPHKVYFKVITILLAIVGVFACAYLLFVGNYTIYWLPLAMPVLACAIATVSGLGWTYLVEDKQRRVLRKFLAQYVSPDVAKKLDEIGTVSLGGVKRELSMLFSDIAGFTDLSELLSSDQLEKFMNFYLSEMSAVVFAHNGTLDKYIGDAIMSFWNAPLDQPDHAVLACRTALGMHRREEEIRPLLAAMGAGNIHTRIGLHTGPANVGNYGSLQKLNYTALGDNVNLASRLEGANKIYGSNILVAQPTVELTRDTFLFRQLDLLRVKGKKKPMAVYELLAERNGDEKRQHLAKDFTEAFAAYQKQDWNEAERILIALLETFPDDAPTGVLLKRVRDFRVSPPPPGWDGVHIAKDK